MENNIFTNDFFSFKSVEEKHKKLKEYCGGFSPWIVYLDDDLNMLELVSSKLKSFGFLVKATASSSEAEDFIQKNRSLMSLILVDYNMPEMNGFEFRKKIVQFSEVPFVILSGFVDREMALEGINLKISSFLEKPLDDTDFRNILLKEVGPRVFQIKEDLELLSSFLSDADLIVEQMEEIFLELEERPSDKELLQKAYGLLHTMKGNAGFFEPRSLHEFSHKFEDQIKMVHEGKLSLNSAILSSWLKATDIIKTLIEEFKTFKFENKELAQYLVVFDIEASKNAAGQSNAGDVDARQEVEKPKEIRVSVSVLDEFMMVSGEMTVIRNMINKSVLSLEKKYSSDKDVQLLTELLNEMHKINAEVQNKITDIRRVGVKSILRPLTRTARDTARSLDKDIEMHIHGDELRVDHSISELLSHSLIHLVRNSIDHGMETKEERSLTDKQAKGKLALDFADQGDFVEANISDDGRGLDPKKLRQKVKEKNLRTDAQLESMSDEDVYQLIFDAGFSTAEQVTQYSGRGVGLNMVKSSVEELGGSIQILSKLGKGTTFNIKVPIPKSATIASCLFSEIDGQTFGIVQDHIEKVLRLNKNSMANINRIEKALFYRHNECLLPVVEFRKNNLEIKETKLEEDEFLLIIKTEKYHFCLVSANIFDVEDSVIKELQMGGLKNLQLYQGGTFLPDGSVGLVIDVDGLAEHCGVGKQLLLAKGFDRVDALSTKIEPVELGRYISFEVEGVGRSCLPELDVLRVEEMPIKNIQESGAWALMPYHHSLIYFVDTNLYFKQGVAVSIVREEIVEQTIKVVVLGLENIFIGLVVKEIYGLEEVANNLIPMTKPISSCKGRLMIDEKVFCVIDIKNIKDPENGIVLDGAQKTNPESLNAS